MVEWIKRVVETAGYPGIAFLMFLENVFPPIPSEAIMPLAGYVSTQEQLTYWGVVVAGTLGSVAGALPLYYLGYLVGDTRLRRWVAGHGHWFALEAGDLERADRWFARHGQKTVFFARLVPGVRSLISIPAGVARMPLGRFLVGTTLGAGLWTAGLAGVGVWLGPGYEQARHVIEPIGTVVIGALVVMYGVRVWRLRARAKARRRAADGVRR